MHAVALRREHSTASASALVVQHGVHQLAADVQQHRRLVRSHNGRKGRLATVRHIPAHGYDESRTERYV